MKCENCLNEYENLSLVSEYSNTALMGLKCCGNCIKDFEVKKRDIN